MSPFFEELVLDCQEALAGGDVEEEQRKIEAEYQCSEITKEERDKLLEILAYEPC